MNLRSLLPWLLLGALLASGAVNVMSYRGQKVPPVGASTTSVPGYHLAPGASTEKCPTLNQLDLTKAQRDQIRTCSLNSLDLRTGLAVEIDQASVELRSLLAQDGVNSKRVLDLADRISSLRSKQYRAWISSILVVRKVLNAEQRQRLRELEDS